MGTTPYSDPRSAATSVNELVRYLKATDDGTYLYRGQIRDYPGPLLPSAYRNYVHTHPVYDLTSPEIKFRMRGVGRRFVGTNHSTAYWEYVARTMQLNYEE